MLQRIGPFLLLFSLAYWLFAQAQPKQPAAPAAAKVSVPELSMEVAALQALVQFGITPEQMAYLRKLAPETMSETGARPAAKVSSEYRRTLMALRDALAKSTEPDRIGELQERLEKLRDTEAPDLDDGVEITDAAREKAPAVLQRLSARQVAGFLAAYGDDFPDPGERLQAALQQVRELSDKDWKETRDVISADVSRLVAGLDPEKCEEVANQVVQLLIKVRAFKPEDLKQHQAELEAEARRIVGKQGPFEILRHATLHALAELLSNPRLTAALDACGKK